MAVTPKQAAAAIQAYKKNLPVAIIRGLRKAMPIAVRIAKLNYMERKDNRHPIRSFDPANPPPGPLGIRQGNLARTIKVGDIRYSGKRVTATIHAGSDEVRYAAIHEYGGEIMARNGPYLIFPMASPGGGYSIVRTPKVLIQARPYLRPAVVDATPKIIEIVQREMMALARVTLKDVAKVRG